eukprot:TRINITY_DN16007_c0_g1_i1.p1 TRINITY_DN16007_c0_g1~~TRINITY_DN16007_c0_g1_i1.p1  ORF type:complete len:159 (-),score=34.99 TRINITY_DN16007_c0_g1_i1:22-498(-)
MDYKHLEILLDITAGLGTLGTIFLCIRDAPVFPNNIPIHFDITGKADYFVKNRAAVTMVSTIAISNYVFNNAPFSLIQLIKRDTGDVELTKSTALNRMYKKMMGTTTSLLLFGIQYYTLSIANNQREGLPKYIIGTALTAYAITSFGHYYLDLKSKQE